MLEIRDAIEQHLWWEPRGGTSSIWYDNWSNLGPLHLHQSGTPTCHPMRDIRDLFNEEGWDFDALHDVVPEYVVDHITHNMRFLQLEDLADKPWWTKSRTGYFSVKSVWEVLRKKENVSEDFKSLWVKGLSFKFSFLAWRIWREKIHVANVIHAWNPNISQNSRCCNTPENKSINHLFLR